MGNALDILQEDDPVITLALHAIVKVAAEVDDMRARNQAHHIVTALLG